MFFAKNFFKEVIPLHKETKTINFSAFHSFLNLRMKKYFLN